MAKDEEIIEYNGYTIHIKRDINDGDGPRDWDNMGTMICFHRRYELGDKHVFTQEGFDGWLATNKDDIIVLPLYLYDHSGITISTVPFNDHWDSGKIGYIYMTKAKAREEFGWKVVTKRRRDKILDCLRGEVETYDQYLRGEVYGYVIEGKEGKDVDSCWGYYGKDCVIQDAKSVVDNLLKKVELEDSSSKTRTMVDMQIA